MSMVILEKCDEAHLRSLFQIKLANDWSRFRSKMVKIFDKYYFKEM